MTDEKREKSRAYHRAYRANNAERVRAYEASFRRRHRARIRAYARAYARKDPALMSEIAERKLLIGQPDPERDDRAKAKKRAWVEANHDHIRKQRRARYAEMTSEERSRIAERKKEYRAKNQDKVRHYRRQWYEKNRERISAQSKVYNAARSGNQRLARLKLRFGLGYEHFELLASAQGNACAICRRAEVALVRRGDHERPRSLSVDHDHTDGSVRGLLCGNCNRGLGAFRDSANNLIRALAYLKNPPARRLLRAREKKGRRATKSNSSDDPDPDGVMFAATEVIRG